jgi:NADH-quinone oxidoreductase subunit K
MVPLWMFLAVAAALFCLGAYTVLSRRNAVAILMGVELMLNAVNLNLVAFWRFQTPLVMSGQAFAAFVLVAGDYHRRLSQPPFGDCRRRRPAEVVG